MAFVPSPYRVLGIITVSAPLQMRKMFFLWSWTITLILLRSEENSRTLRRRNLHFLPRTSRYMTLDLFPLKTHPSCFIVFAMQTSSGDGPWYPVTLSSPSVSGRTEWHRAMEVKNLRTWAARGPEASVTALESVGTPSARQSTICSTLPISW